MDKDKELDNLFKRGFDNPPLHPPDMMEDDWDAMEAMLDEGKKRPGVVYWLPILSSVAALLLIIFGIWWFKPELFGQKNEQVATIKKTGQDSARKQQTVETYAQNKRDTIQPFKGQQKKHTEQIAQNSSTNTGQFTRPQNAGSTAAGSRQHVKPYVPVGNQFQSGAVANNHASVNSNPVNAAYAGAAQTGNGQGAQTPDNGNTLPANAPAVTNAVAVIAQNTPASKPADTTGRTKPAAVWKDDRDIASNNKKANKKDGVAPFRPQYAISVLGSSDLNGANSAFQQSKVGTNVGALFSAQIFRRFTISTGALYSSKPYSTNLENYTGAYHFKSTPTNIAADCRMFDIPLNIDYNIYDKHRNKFSVGTGVSSYLMFHESYQYSYAAGGYGPSGFNVANPGKYYLSIMNLQATYVRQLNSKFGLEVQPYMKVPLSGVGQFSTRLESTGVAVGLTWNLGNHQ